MQKKDPYQVVKSIHVTEKAMTLQQLVNNDSTKCVARCESPKYVFIVDKRANKNEIAEAVEHIYKENNIKVVTAHKFQVL